MRTTNTRTIRLVQLALFTAIIILMAFTPLGYLRVGALSITLLVIPVSVGAIIMGPTSGAILGAIFGLTSLAQCFGLDPFGTTLFGINPFGTIVLCLLPRILMGWLTGLIYYGIKRRNTSEYTSHMVANISGPILNTVLFMSALVIFFYNSDYIQGIAADLGANHVISFILLFVGLNAVVEAIVTFIVGSAISKSLEKVLARK